jgi:hypothetical protein
MTAPIATWISTRRVGQLTGSTDAKADAPRWPELLDAEHWPLINDTGAWGAAGLDLGANTEHSDGRLYFFFGDTTRTDDSPNRQNADLVAWTADPLVLRRGGHRPAGWTFVLPFEPTDVGGQSDWRFCGQCGGLFWDGDDNFRGRCPAGGAHAAAGLNFSLPHNPGADRFTEARWRFCIRCSSLVQND